MPKETKTRQQRLAEIAAWRASQGRTATPTSQPPKTKSLDDQFDDAVKALKAAGVIDPNAQPTKTADVAADGMSLSFSLAEQIREQDKAKKQTIDATSTLDDDGYGCTMKPARSV